MTEVGGGATCWTEQAADDGVVEQPGLRLRE